MRGDESYAGSESYYRLKSVLFVLTGLEHFVPTFQGHACQCILCKLVGGKGKVVPNIAHFDTIRANFEHA